MMLDSNIKHIFMLLTISKLKLYKIYHDIIY